MNWPILSRKPSAKHRVNKANMLQPQEEFINDVGGAAENSFGEAMVSKVEPVKKRSEQGRPMKETWSI